ncbi:hypothetical protein WN48_09534 [Eufriesea mexicana]|nr:hypothetical protein WN48_09534 [Eufriesea mexicana]
MANHPFHGYVAYLDGELQGSFHRVIRDKGLPGREMREEQLASAVHYSRGGKTPRNPIITGGKVREENKQFPTPHPLPPPLAPAELKEDLTEEEYSRKGVTENGRNKRPDCSGNKRKP